MRVQINDLIRESGSVSGLNYIIVRRVLLYKI